MGALFSNGIWYERNEGRPKSPVLYGREERCGNRENILVV